MELSYIFPGETHSDQREGFLEVYRKMMNSDLQHPYVVHLLLVALNICLNRRILLILKDQKKDVIEIGECTFYSPILIYIDQEMEYRLLFLNKKYLNFEKTSVLEAEKLTASEVLKQFQEIERIDKSKIRVGGGYIKSFPVSIAKASIFCKEYFSLFYLSKSRLSQ